MPCRPMWQKYFAPEYVLIIKLEEIYKWEVSRGLSPLSFSRGLASIFFKRDFTYLMHIPSPS